jgi:hypothetical protein
MPVVDVNIISAQNKSKLSDQADSGSLHAKDLKNFHHVVGSGSGGINPFD